MSGAAARFCARAVSQLQLHARAAILPRRGSRIKGKRLAKVGNEAEKIDEEVEWEKLRRSVSGGGVFDRERLSCLLTFGEGRGTDCSLGASISRRKREREGEKSRSILQELTSVIGERAREGFRNL